jgi:oxygen-dependent protoporphyrinogen oxidase
MIGKLNLENKNVTVVGGGMAGLLAAYELDRQGYRVRLIEAENRLGGLIQTTQTPFGIAESAAHSILVTEPVGKFFRELGIELVPVNAQAKARFILRDGRMRRFPLGIGEAIYGFLRAYFVLANSRTPTEKLTVAEWADHFLGQAFRKYLFTPMIRGIYGATPEQIVIGAAFPALAVPRGHSLISFQLAKRFRKSYRRKYGPPDGKKKKRAVMMSPRYGMESVVQALELKLREKLRDRLVTGERITELPDVENLVLTVPSSVASELIKKVSPELAHALERIDYSPLICVTVFVDRSSLAKVPQGVGVLIPDGEDSRCLGILFNSSSFPERVKDPDRWVSCTVMMGGSTHPDYLAWTDSEVKAVIQKEFSTLFGLRGDLVDCEIRRWVKAVPQYNQSLIDTWALAQKTWCAQPGHVLFGNYTGQVSLRGMIESLKGINP